MNDYELLQELEEERIPSKTYHIEGTRIIGHVDGLDAVRQAVEKVMLTERFLYNIYTAVYGIELDRFVGAEIDYIRADLERTILDALTADDRISGISNFKMELKNKNSLVNTFRVNTAVGSFNIYKEVNL